MQHNTSGRRYALPAFFISALAHGLALMGLNANSATTTPSASTASASTLPLQIAWIENDVRASLVATSVPISSMPKPQRTLSKTAVPKKSTTSTKPAALPLAPAPALELPPSTRRSLAFSSARLHAENESTAPVTHPRPNDILKEGLVRSAEQVAGFLASIPDQQCALELTADRKNATPTIRCNQAEAEIALQAAPPETLAALVTWLRANDVLRIEFFMEAGATRFRTRS